jgi:exodeoxyribonuclease-3
MKIISWNVNGLRAVLSKGALNDVKKHKPDVLCLQEIKVKPEQLSEEQTSEMEGFHGFWNSAQRPGYSGVATFSRGLPDFNKVGLGDERFDVEGRTIRTDFEGITLLNIYVPNGQRDQTRLKYKLDFYAKLLEICDDLHDTGRQIIICGDINTAHQPIDLRNPKQNEKTSGFLPEERAWIDKYLEHELIDIYREVHGERVQYTWWTYRVNARQRNIGWRLDYFLISKDLINKVKDVIIYDEIEGSDHCPIGLDIRTRS